MILIGGTSHTGKSSLAVVLAASEGWISHSTDSLARHPGRPWATPPAEVPALVSDYYLSLPTEAQIVDMLNHYRSLWPEIEALARWHASRPGAERLVLEGSALLPDLVATLELDEIASVWLVANEELIRQRIRQESQYSSMEPRQRKLVDRFVERSVTFNCLVAEACGQHGRHRIDVDPGLSPKDLSDAVSRELISC